MERVAVVLAGGLGTRLRAVTGGRVAKAMVPVLGRPFIDHKLASLRKMGISDVLMLVGAAADQIVDHVGDGTPHGLRVRYLHDGATLLGTGGSIRAALNSLPERFWVTYGDSLVHADLDMAETLMDAALGDAVMTVLENADRWEPSNVGITDGRVVDYRKGAAAGTFRWVDYGLLCFRADVFRPLVIGSPTDLATVIHPLIARRAMIACPVTERFWDVGTPEALQATEDHLRRISTST